MAYEKQNFKDGDILTAEQLNHIEDGIDALGVVPDLSVNDESDPAYVKNRPFYQGDPAETVLVEESTVSFIDGAAEFPSTFAAVIGETYTVYWDGTAYERQCFIFNGSTPAIGNMSIPGMGSDTGEPFFMAIGKKGMTIITKDTSDSHTFSISGMVAQVVKIDEKYLPTIPADKLPTIPAAKLPTIPADKLPTIPAIEFTTSIGDNIENDIQPSFTVSNLSYSEIYSLVEKGSFQIKDSDGSHYRPIYSFIDSSGNIFVDILVSGRSMTYAQLVCSADKTRFYRSIWWQIEATKK